MTQEDWETRLVAAIAEQVRHRRDELGLSGQELSARCAQRGFPIHRSVIANLENGRRGTVSVAELLVLAAALDVPAFQLLAPLDSEGAELLPGRKENRWIAAERLSGLGPAQVALLHEFNRLAAALRDQVESLPGVRARTLGPLALHESMIRNTYQELLSARRRFAEQGWTEPELPNGDLRKRLEELFGQVSDASQS